MEQRFKENEMASDDLTQQLPDEERTTQPTIITVLERIQALDERMQRSEGRTENRFDRLEHQIASEIASLREEMNRNFRKLETKIQLLNEDILNMRETQRDALHRIIDLEHKPL
jgi:phage host-nuclease inhibitor protein Gam